MNISIGWRARLGVVLAVGSLLSGCNDENGPSPPNPPAPVANTPPTANAGADQVIAAGGTVSLNGGGSSDTNGTITTYAWTQTSGTAITLSSAGTATPGFTAPAAPGALAFQLTVTDNGGASHSDTVTVTVNAPPVANAGTDQTVSAGAAVSLSGSGTDADGSVASYVWTQTAGPALTLANTSGATLTFTAPVIAANLAFDFIVTDNHGGTHVDSVSVTVTPLIVQPPPPAAPMIGRQPGDARAYQLASALIFVAASGDDLIYEWRRSSGAVVKTGPEPFLLRSNLPLHSNGDCFYVVISNSAGAVTSEEGCLTVEPLGEVEPPEGSELLDNPHIAGGFGEVLMEITQFMVGPLTGVTLGHHLGLRLGPSLPYQCHLGSYGGLTIDGVLQTVPGPLPLGQHSVTVAWDDCHDDPDDTIPRNGGFMVEYDFPDTLGVGTFTVHRSEDFINGTVHATVVANNVNGDISEDIEITLADNFSVGGFEALSPQSITIERRYDDDDMRIEQASLDLTDVGLRVYLDDDSTANVHPRQGGFFLLHQEFDGGDDGVPDHSSTGLMVVGTIDRIIASLEASGSTNGWYLDLMPPDECPEGYICVEPPVGP